MALDRPEPLNSLGFAKPPAETRVVVAMSGGVDSSVVAAVLAEEGYDVVGVTLQLYDHGAALAKKGACCAGRDIHDARRVAEAMGFPHYVLDYENTFREAVIDEFADSYLAGATPGALHPLQRAGEVQGPAGNGARDLDADCMATGHYIQRKMGPAKAELHCATTPRATSPISCSPPRRRSWISCASPWATSRPRPTRARWRRNTGYRWPTSPTVRTSVSCRMATMPP
jgi:tRNA-specific 2-thiouridylase